MANGFVSTSGFSLPEDVLARLRRSSFVTGRDPGPETTRAVIEAGLNVQARRESDLAARTAALNEAERGREQQESQFQRSQVFAESESARARTENEKQRSAEFKGGIASAVTSAAATIGGFALLKHFKII